MLEPHKSLRISSSGNNVYVVWEDNTLGNIDILFRESNDGGMSFGPTINLSNNAGSSHSPQNLLLWK